MDSRAQAAKICCHSTSFADNCNAQSCRSCCSCCDAGGSLQRQPASGEVGLGYDDHEDQQQQQQSTVSEHHNRFQPPPFVDSQLNPADTVAAESSAVKGSGVLVLRPHSAHPLDPLTPTEIAVAIAIVRAEGDTPEASGSSIHQSIVLLFDDLLLLLLLSERIVLLFFEFLPTMKKQLQSKKLYNEIFAAIIIWQLQVRDGMRFVEVVLNEPGKNVVALADDYYFPPNLQPMLCRSKALKAASISPSQQQLPPRQARLVVYNKKTNKTSIWLVELSDVLQARNAPSAHHCAKILSSVVVPDVQPPMDADEYAECEATVKEHGPFVEAMKKRGIHDMELVMVDPWCVGYYGEEDAPSRRLARPLVFCKTPGACPLENGYARPVEGIHVLVDMQQMKVIEFEDRYLVPLPPPDPLRNYTAASLRGGVDRTDIKPLLISQPEGPSFRVNGYAVEWQKWKFRVGFTPREGLVIHTVAYDDGNHGRRSIAYRLSFVEMVVPYGDPKDPHYRKNAFDVGEDGLGKNCHSLKRGCDCLGYIKYFDAHFTNFHGEGETVENCVCMHEEDHGIMWKHQDWCTGFEEVRRSRRLTVSFFWTGYKLMPGSNCLPLASPDAKFLRRAAFLNHNLWVTQYNRDECFPGGEFPNQNPRVGEGLATWIKQDRKLEETDIVLWYVFGVTHVPRLEDWPVMPVEHIGFHLKPHGFFSCSPAIDIPPSKEAVETTGRKEVTVKEVTQPDTLMATLISKL